MRLQLVEPTALPPVCLPVVWSLRLPSSWNPSLRRPVFKKSKPAGFIATMVPLTPVRASHSHRSLCFMDRTFRTFRLQPPLVARDIMSLCFMSRFNHGLWPSSRNRSLARFCMARRLRLYTAGSPRQQAESLFFSCLGHFRFGPSVRLPMLSTPPHGDPVSLGYSFKL